MSKNRFFKKNKRVGFNWFRFFINQFFLIYKSNNKKSLQKKRVFNITVNRRFISNISNDDLNYNSRPKFNLFLLNSSNMLFNYPKNNFFIKKYLLRKIFFNKKIRRFRFKLSPLTIFKKNIKFKAINKYKLVLKKINNNYNFYQNKLFLFYYKNYNNNIYKFIKFNLLQLFIYFNFIKINNSNKLSFKIVNYIKYIIFNLINSYEFMFFKLLEKIKLIFKSLNKYIKKRYSYLNFLKLNFKLHKKFKFFMQFKNFSFKNKKNIKLKKIKKIKRNWFNINRQILKEKKKCLTAYCKVLRNYFSIKIKKLNIFNYKQLHKKHLLRKKFLRLSPDEYFLKKVKLRKKKKYIFKIKCIFTKQLILHPRLERFRLKKKQYKLKVIKLLTIKKSKFILKFIKRISKFKFFLKKINIKRNKNKKKKKSKFYKFFNISKIFKFYKLLQIYFYYLTLTSKIIFKNRLIASILKFIFNIYIYKQKIFYYQFNRLLAQLKFYNQKFGTKIRILRKEQIRRYFLRLKIILHKYQNLLRNMKFIFNIKKTSSNSIFIYKNFNFYKLLKLNRNYFTCKQIYTNYLFNIEENIKQLNIRKKSGFFYKVQKKRFKYKHKFHKHKHQHKFKYNKYQHKFKYNKYQHKFKYNESFQQNKSKFKLNSKSLKKLADPLAFQFRSKSVIKTSYYNSNTNFSKVKTKFNNVLKNKKKNQ
jgi:hypothetical protein